MKKLYILLAFVCVLQSCSKDKTAAADPVPVPGLFTDYTIAAGAHYCDQTAIKPITVTTMKFKVKFDETAVYSTIDPQNQYDINKLFGFTEGQDPHFNSARIGWSFNDGALRLYAYAYKQGERRSREISTVAIGEIVECSILVQENNYVFKVNDKEVILSRAVAGLPASGYQLFPYFGGDETAPHAIRIQIKAL